MQLELSSEEQALLLRILKDYRGTLRQEIYRTEAGPFKHDLKLEEELLERLVARLGAGQPLSAG
ncbi:MAG TPA: hypothetical protein VFA60_07035 [Terriglobales bacterium]|nr:hypothetical protein [Terriglobales bacterium]